MSREIKFRAWDNENKCFFKPTYEAYNGKLEDLSIDFSGELMRRTLQMPAEHESSFPNRFVLNQYTGLKDKNGKEIYEGDILREVQWGSGNVYKVVWRDDGWHLDGADGEVYDNGDYYHGYDVTWLYFEVIGNIYETPELLKKED